MCVCVVDGLQLQDKKTRKINKQSKLYLPLGRLHSPNSDTRKKSNDTSKYKYKTTYLIAKPVKALPLVQVYHLILILDLVQNSSNIIITQLWSTNIAINLFILLGKLFHNIKLSIAKKK